MKKIDFEYVFQNVLAVSIFGLVISLFISGIIAITINCYWAYENRKDCIRRDIPLAACERYLIYTQQGKDSK